MDRTAVRRRRTALVTLGLTVGIGFVGGRASAASPRPEAARAYVVKAGDTVWDIAKRVVGPRGDPRATVDALIAANHLAGGEISTGQRLAMPSP